MKSEKLSLILMAGILLGTDTCEPQLPEEDVVLASDPEAIQRLREKHGEFLVMYTDYINGNLVTIPPDSAMFQRLTEIDGAIPSVVRLTGAQFNFSDQINNAHCGENNGAITFFVDVELRRAFGRTRPEQFVIGSCPSEDFRWISPFFRNEDPPEFDPERLSMVLNDVFAQVDAAMDDYINAFEREQHAILHRQLGCPEGTLYTHSSTINLTDEKRPMSHWCAHRGTRHGPYIQGHLDAMLEGIRLIEGHFQDGAKDGRWVTRDESGAVLEESWWAAGVKSEPPSPSDH